MGKSTSGLASLSAIETARRLSRREITAVQVTQACLDRIDELEPVVHAWTALQPDAALRRAAELDRNPGGGVLHGLSLGVKDLFDTCDLPTSYGSPIYAGHQPGADAAVVALCRSAGAVVLGKTVTTEFATFDPGPTCNPHNPRHTPGGSSSGSAAAVAANMAHLAFGTQTAGSIIRPAAFCGIVGFKPTFGRITRAGVKSLSESLDTVGGFGRSVDDVGLLASALTGDRRFLDLHYDGRPRVGLCRTHDWSEADADTRAAMEQAASGLSRAGARVADVALPDLLARMGQIQARIMAFEASQALAHERVAHPEKISAALTGMLRIGQEISYVEHQRNLALAAQGQRAIDNCFEHHDVLLAPSAPGEAPAGLDATGDPVFCRMWTLLGLPCVHLPFTVGTHGLPVGLQVIGRFDADYPMLTVARWMHQQLRALFNLY